MRLAQANLSVGDLLVTNPPNDYFILEVRPEGVVVRGISKKGTAYKQFLSLNSKREFIHYTPETHPERFL